MNRTTNIAINRISKEGFFIKDLNLLENSLLAISILIPPQKKEYYLSKEVIFPCLLLFNR